MRLEVAMWSIGVPSWSVLRSPALLGRAAICRRALRVGQMPDRALTRFPTCRLWVVTERADPRLESGSEIPAWYLGPTPLAAMPWLIRLRWATAAADAVVLASSGLLAGFTFPLGRLTPLVAASLLMNSLVAVWLSRRGTLPKSIALSSLMLDVALLTGLLEITGGPFNPFSVI